MTGNKIAWRAPLAGLASLAMVATMGVAAGTANAADADEVTVTFGSAKVTADYGESIADVLFGETDKTVGMDSSKGEFQGWYQGGKLADLTAPLTGDVTLSAKYAPADNTVPVTFTYNSSELAAPLLYASTVNVAKNANLNAQQLPTDVPGDSKLVSEWTVTYKLADGGQSVKKVSDLTKVNVGNSVSVEAKATGYYKSVVKADFQKNGYTNGVIANAASDNSYSDENYTVDVAVPGKTVAPTWTRTPSASDTTVPTGWEREDGTKYAFAATAEVTKDNAIFTLTDEAKVATVTFVDDKNGTTVRKEVKFDKTNPATGNMYGTLAGVDIDDPSYEGLVFTGWSDGKTLVSKDARDNTVTFANYKVWKPVTLTAQWKSVETVNVIFRDTADYADAREDVTVPTAAGDFVDPSKVPAWTRDGYILSWTVEANGKSVAFDPLTQQVNVDLAGQDFIVQAVWTKATIDMAKAALNYVTVGINDVSVFPDAVNGGAYDAPSDASYFTKESFAEFTKVEQAQYQAYKKYLYQGGNAIDAKQSAEIVNKLAAAWKELVFEHTGDNDPAFTDETAVHRLYNAALDEHFYSEDKTELLTLTAPATNGSWKDEGVLFRSGNRQFAKFADADLYKVASPIVSEYTRFYNPSNGDHVWALTGGEEYDTLKPQAAWNEEGVAFAVPTYTGSRDVVRQYQPAKSRHLLSTDPAEQKLNETRGWTTEGVAFKAY